MTFGSNPFRTIAIAVVLALLVEAGLQVRAHVRTGQSAFNILLGRTTYVDDPFTGLTLLRPNAVVKGSTFEMRSNSWGLRSEQLPVERESGEIRIALLGASTIMGTYAPTNEQVAAYALERLLQSRSGRPVRVINAGIAGLSIEEQLQLLEKRLIPAGVSAAIWYPGTNDISCERKYGKSGNGTRRLEPPNMPKWMLTHSLIVKNTFFIRRRLASHQESRRSRNDFLEVRETLVKGVEISRRAGVELALATTTQKFSWSQSQAERERAATSALYSRPCFSATGLLREIDGLNSVIRSVSDRYSVPLAEVHKELTGKEAMFGDATHLSVAGEARLADLLADTVVQRMAVMQQR